MSNKCPECGRTVTDETMVCPDCGTVIEDAEFSDFEDLEQEYSDSFEEEYQNMGNEEVNNFRNIHTDEEFKRFDELIAALRKACTEAEQSHIQYKRAYRGRELCKCEANLPAMAASLRDLIPLIGSLYEKSRKHIRGVCWLRHIVNMLCRGIPTDLMEEYDEAYFHRVLHWIPLEEDEKEELIELFETW